MTLADPPSPPSMEFSIIDFFFNPSLPLAIKTQLHATSHVFCFMCFLNQVLSLAVSQAKILSTPVYLLHGADLKFWLYTLYYVVF